MDTEMWIDSIDFEYSESNNIKYKDGDKASLLNPVFFVKDKFGKRQKIIIKMKKELLRELSRRIDIHFNNKKITQYKNATL